MLKRLARALSAQDWFAVSLELLIVVIGIVVGFQVTAWGEARAERELERELLEGLRTEFALNQELYNQSVVEHERTIDQARRLLQFTGPNPTGFDEIVLDSLVFDAISTIPSFYPSSGELEAILGAGQLGLIRNERIRASLAAWPVAVARLRETESEMRNDVMNAFFPYVLERIPLVTMDAAVGFIDTPPSRFPRRYEELLSEVEFENHVENRWVMARFILDDGEQVGALVERITRLISEELDSP